MCQNYLYSLSTGGESPEPFIGPKDLLAKRISEVRIRGARSAFQRLIVRKRFRVRTFWDFLAGVPDFSIENKSGAEAREAHFSSKSS